MFDHIENRKYFAARRIFNSLLGVWKCGQIRSVVFDILFAANPRLSLVANNKITSTLDSG